jgi:hypothetical protein
MLSMLLISGCSLSPDTVPTITPFPTDTPLPGPTANQPYTPDEQVRLTQWCKDFKALNVGVDQLQVDAQAWFESLGHSPNQEVIDDAQVIVRMYLDLYLQAGGLDQIPRVQEINDTYSEAIYSKEFAYAYLQRALTEGSKADYDQYLELIGQAENGMTAATDRFNDAMGEVSISPETCEIISE